MLTLFSCKTCRYDGSYINAGEAIGLINIYLCRVFETALAVKRGLPSSAITAYCEATSSVFHGLFEGLPDVTVLHNAGESCDICALTRAVKRLAYSAYADDVADFIKRTHDGRRENIRRRAEFSLATAFKRFLAETTSGKESRIYLHMENAAMMVERLHSITTIHPQYGTIKIEKGEKSLPELSKRIDVILGNHLRVVN